jgi:hypothetical protein
MRVAQNLLGAPTIGRGNGRAVDGGVGSQRSQIHYAPKPPGMYKNGEKMGGFPHVLACKSPKTLFLTQEYSWNVF